MADYIETQTQDGTTLRIEVEPGTKTTAGFGGRAAPATDVSTEATRHAYEQMLTAIRACANGLVDTLQKLDASPNDASLNFSLRVDEQAGAMIAKTLGEGQFKISLNWKQIDQDED